MNGWRNFKFFALYAFLPKEWQTQPWTLQLSSLNFGLALLTIVMGLNAISGHWFGTGAGSRCGSFSPVKCSRLLLPCLPYHTCWWYPQLPSANLEGMQWGLRHQQWLCLGCPSEYLLRNPGWVHPYVAHDIWWITPVSKTDVDAFFCKKKKKPNKVKRYFILKTKQKYPKYHS